MGEGSHLHNILKLLIHIPERKLSMFELLDQLLVVLESQVLDGLDEALDIAHAEQFGDERLGAERLQIVYVLAGTDEDDGRARGRHADGDKGEGRGYQRFNKCVLEKADWIEIISC